MEHEEVSNALQPHLHKCHCFVGRLYRVTTTKIRTYLRVYGTCIFSCALESAEALAKLNGSSAANFTPVDPAVEFWK